MLVRPLQIQIRRPVEPLSLVQHTFVGHPRIEPDIKRIGDLFVVLRVITQQLTGIEVKPGIDAVALHPHRDLLHQPLSIWVQITRHFVHKQRNRHAPGTLAGDTPVGPVSQHAVDPRAAPIRDPLHALHRLLGGRQQTIACHADKPLGRCTEDDRGLVPPTVRIAVLERFVAQENAALRQGRDDVIIGLKDMLACKHRRVRVVDAITADGVIHLQVVALTHVKVFKAVCRRSVHAASTCLGGHMITQNDRHRRLIKGRRQRQPFQRATLGSPDDLHTFSAKTLGTGFGEGFSDNNPAAIERK